MTHLLGNDSHELSSLIFFFEKVILLLKIRLQKYDVSLDKIEDPDQTW